MLISAERYSQIKKDLARLDDLELEAMLEESRQAVAEGRMLAHSEVKRRLQIKDKGANIVHDLREILRLAAGRKGKPTAAIFDSRTLQSTPESGGRAEYDGAKRRKGSKTHIAVDTLGNLLALHVTPANEQDRAQVGQLAEAVQEVTGETVEVVFVDQGYTGETAAQEAEAHGIRLEVVKLPEAKKGFVLLPRRWVVERSFGWAARFRRLARDYERLPETLAGLHFLTFAILMLKRFIEL